VAALLAERGEDELIWMAVDSSVVERPDAQTSEDRGIIHLSNLPLVDKPIGVGWTVSSVVLLPEQPCSWVPIFDHHRVRTDQTPFKWPLPNCKPSTPFWKAAGDPVSRPRLLYSRVFTGLPRPGHQCHHPHEKRPQALSACRASPQKGAHAQRRSNTHQPKNSRV
jgi:hypothetical protein